ncbi:hypothetical protein EGW08_007400 [Elysia chlorotica]|uniref:G-protein coupled receptors family 1 profile domain-containing protein n=1 Tax=Elysia chlorotica TaxID=188477 RepID=A0A3S1A7X6_ELYCH|nr:hypothetical protein EGW08_007400 [Elysia chlorotica]
MNCTLRSFNASTTTTPTTSNSSAGGDPALQQALPELCDFNTSCRFRSHWGWLVLMISLASVTCSANLLSLVVLRRMHATMSPVMRLALMNLSLTDVVGSLSYIYHSVMSFTTLEVVGVECKIRYLFYVGMNVVTLYTLIYMTVERLVAVTLPFLHVRVDGKKFTAVALTLIWVASMATLVSGMHRLRTDLDLCLYHVMVPKTTHLLNASLALPTIVFIVLSNLALYVRARREITKIGRTMVSSAEDNQRERQLAHMAEKAASTTLAVVVPFASFNTPLYVLMLVFYCRPEFMYSCRSVGLLMSFSTLLVLNSLCNPIIYAWKLRPVQVELAKMLRMRCLARKSGPAPTVVSTVVTRLS